MMIMDLGLFLLVSGFYTMCSETFEVHKNISSLERNFGLNSERNYFCISVQNSEMTQLTFLINNLLQCKWDHIVLFTNSESNYQIAEFALKLVHSNTVPVTEFDIHKIINDKDIQQLENVIWKAYNKMQLTNFMWLSNRAVRLTQALERLFEKTKHEIAALMPHNLKLFMFCESSDFVELEVQLRNTSMDNIAVFVMNGEHKYSVHTLMWRNNRRRELDDISKAVYDQRKEVVNICRIFPNVKNGLNQRNILVVTKEWLPRIGYVYKTSHTGEWRYDGFLIQVIHILAETLNFTVTFIPDPGQNTSLKWKELEDLVSEAKVDIAATLYTLNSMRYYNHSLSAPVVFSNVIGVYANREIPAQFQFFAAIDRLAFYFLSLFFCMTVIVYLIVNSCHNKQSIKEKDMFRDNQGLKHTSKNVIINQSENVAREVVNFSSVMLSVAVPLSEGEIASSCKISGDVTDSPLPTFYTNDIFVNQTEGMTGKTERVIENKVIVRFIELKYEHENMSLPAADNPSTNQVLSSSQPKYSSLTQSLGREKRVTGLNLASVVRGLKLFYNDYVMDILFHLMGSGTLTKSPTNIHERIILCSWYLLQVIFTAIMTSNLTASFINPIPFIPFTTFDEMITRGDYQWGLSEYISDAFYLFHVENGSILKKIVDGCEDISVDFTDHEISEQFIHKLQHENFVVILGEIDYEVLSNNYKYH